MIGNDVVDLADRDAHGLHPRFDRKALDEAERAALELSPDPHRLRWTFWAAKEAAYKAMRQADPTVRFAPARFSVRLLADGGGVVRHGDRTACVRIDDSEERVHAVAVLGRPDAVHAAVGHVVRVDVEAGAEAPRRAAREMALGCRARWLDQPAESLGLERIARVPRLRIDGELAPVAISLSHHGRFAACACRVETSALHSLEAR